MAVIFEKQRRIEKIISGLTTIPTIPVGNDHTDGSWNTTDVYEGELCINTDTGKMFFRAGGRIIEVNPDIIIDVAYSELITLSNDSNFKIGQLYRITDYRTIHRQQSYTRDLVTGNVEPIICMAVSPEELAPEVYSESYPKDIIRYDMWDDSTIDGDERPGFITYRKDTEQNLSAEFDFRVVRNRRYALDVDEWVSGSDYTTGQWVAVGGNIYGCIKNITNSTDSPQIDSEHFHTQQMTNGMYLGIAQDYDLVGFGSYSQDYVDYNDYEDYITFPSINDPLIVNPNYFNVHVSRYYGELPNVAVNQTYSKYNQGVFNGMTVKGSKNITVFAKSLGFVNFFNCSSVALYNVYGNASNNADIVDASNTYFSILDNTTLKNISRSSYGSISNSFIGSANNCSLGAEQINIEYMSNSHIDFLNSCDVKMLVSSIANGFRFIKAIGQLTMSMYGESIEAVIINAKIFSHVFPDTANVIKQGGTKEIVELNDGTFKLAYYDNTGKVIVDLDD